MAALCVDAACRMLALLPDEPDPALLYRTSPWALVLHYLMQATTVLLMDLFTREESGSETCGKVLGAIQKAVRWLGEMARMDASSRRAWVVCRDVLSRYSDR